MDTPAIPDPPSWIVAMGASGSEGLGNIKSLLAAFGADLNAVVMIVLHRSFEQKSVLCEVLRSATSMPVNVADDGEKLERGRCYIGEPAAHLTLMERSFGDVAADPERRHRNRTVDLLFKSVAEHAGRHGIGVVLAGELDDGSRGIEAIHLAGGRTMVLLRDPGRPGMPENAITYDGPIDCIGTTAEIAEAIQRVVGLEAGG